MRWIIVTALLLAALVACGSDDKGHSNELSAADIAGSADYVGTVIAWRADRLARLKAPGGYLNLAGLYWLSEGTHSFGADLDNDVVFPGTTARIGEFEIADGGIEMTVENGLDVRIDGQIVESAFMPDDLSGEEVIATFGSLTWAVINRDGRLGVRLHDIENPAIDALPSMPYFDIDMEWRIEGTLRRFDEPKIMNVDTVIEGLGWKPASPGVVEFEYRGERYALEAYESGERLFFVFGDRTSGRETYPAGRFLYAEMPGDDGRTVLDFNLAYNPPCAFNDFSTCPVASPRNRLKFAVAAGEKYDSALYSRAQH